MTPDMIQGFQLILVVTCSTLLLCPALCWTLTLKKA